MHQHQCHALAILAPQTEPYTQHMKLQLDPQNEQHQCPPDQAKWETHVLKIAFKEYERMMRQHTTRTRDKDGRQ
jgi:NADPH-dependent ferric siderophore reductase